jgi:hypothetical protein
MFVGPVGESGDLEQPWMMVLLQSGELANTVQ